MNNILNVKCHFTTNILRVSVPICFTVSSVLIVITIHSSSSLRHSVWKRNYQRSRWWGKPQINIWNQGSIAIPNQWELHPHKRLSRSEGEWRSLIHIRPYWRVRLHRGSTLDSASVKCARALSTPASTSFSNIISGFFCLLDVLLGCELIESRNDWSIKPWLYHIIINVTWELSTFLNSTPVITSTLD